MKSTKFRIRLFSLTILLNLMCGYVNGQKIINHNPVSWVGVFPSYRIGKNWGMVGDLVFARNNYFLDPVFTWVKVGPGYWWTDKPIFFSSGLALLRVPRPDLTNASHTLEYRIDPQIVSWRPLGKGVFLNRFRLDFRSRQNVENNEVLSTRNMSYRFRYLYSYTHPITKGDKPFNLVFVNEVLIQFGNKIVLNTFDQFRVFIGINRKITDTVSFDFGYFPIYSQTAAGNVYNLDHVFRLFIFTDFRSKKSFVGRSTPMPIKDFDEE